MGTTMFSRKQNWISNEKKHNLEREANHNKLWQKEKEYGLAFAKMRQAKPSH